MKKTTATKTKRDNDWVRSMRAWIKQRKLSIEQGEAMIRSNDEQIAIIKKNTAAQREQLKWDKATIKKQEGVLKSYLDTTE